MGSSILRAPNQATRIHCWWCQAFRLFSLPDALALAISSRVIDEVMLLTTSAASGASEPTASRKPAFGNVLKDLRAQCETRKSRDMSQFRSGGQVSSDQLLPRRPWPTACTQTVSCRRQTSSRAHTIRNCVINSSNDL